MMLGQDEAWHIGLAAAFKNFGPYVFRDPRILDTAFVYHFLAHNLWAKFSLIGADGLYESVIAGMRPAGMTVSVFVVCSIFSGFSISIWRSLLGCLGVFGSFGVFTPGNFFSDPFLNILPVHLFSSVTGEELMFGVFVSGLFALYSMLESSKRGFVFLYSICVVLCLGLKGPYALSLAGASVLLLIWTFLKDRSQFSVMLRASIWGCGLFLCGYILYFYKSAGHLSIEFGKTMEVIQIYNLGSDFKSIYNKIFALVPYLLLFFGPSLFAICIFRKKASLGAGEYSAEIAMATVGFFAGLVPFMLLSQEGNSQLYFAFAGQLALNFFVWLFLVNWSEVRARVFIMLFGGYLVVGYSSGFLVGVQTFRQSQHQTFNRACLWLRQNTEISDLIAINKHYIGDRYARFFYCSALAERQFLVEGYEYNDRSLATALKIQELLENNHKIFHEGKSLNQSLSPDFAVFFRDSYGDLDSLKLTGREVYSDDYAVIVQFKK